MVVVDEVEVSKVPVVLVERGVASLNSVRDLCNPSKLNPFLAKQTLVGDESQFDVMRSGLKKHERP